MLSARIKTRVVEDAIPLAQDLRTRGFVVQIVSLDQAGSDPVDLEVTLEECEPEAALRRADATPDADDLRVFVAPGALTDGNRPIKVVPLVPDPSANVVNLPRPAVEVETQKLEEPVLLEGAANLEESVLEESKPELPMAASQAVPVSVPTAQSAPPIVVTEKAKEAPKQQEIPILSPEVWGARVAEEPVLPQPRKRVFYREAVKRFDAWFERAGADDRMVLKAAMLVAIGSVVALSVLVLGATSHRVAPMAAAVESATESQVQTPARVVPVATTPRPKTTIVPAQISEPKPHAHNPEEDIVAHDYVIRYSRRPAPLSAKKSSAVKHISDMR